MCSCILYPATFVKLLSQVASAAFILLCVPCLVHGADITATLDALTKVREAGIENANKPLAEISAKYNLALREHQKDAQKEGDLKSVLAVNTALELQQSGALFSPISEDLKVAKIQQAYQKAYEDLQKQVDARLVEVDRDYANQLEKLIKELTQAGSLADAIKVSKIKEQFIEDYKAKRSVKTQIPAMPIIAGSQKPEEIVAADFRFDPGVIRLDPLDWKNIHNDPDWSFKPPYIIRLSNKRQSSLDFGKSIPTFFEVKFDLTPDTLGYSNGKGIGISDSTGKSWSVCIDDDVPFGIYDIAAHKFAATSSTPKIQVDQSYHFSVLVAANALYATVDGVRLSYPWTATPPFRFGFFSQRSGLRVKNITINDIKKSKTGDFLGKWTGARGRVIDIRPGGDATVDKIRGKWAVKESTLTITWDNGSIDSYDLPPVDGFMSGKNQKGNPLRLKRAK